MMNILCPICGLPTMARGFRGIAICQGHSNAERAEGPCKCPCGWDAGGDLRVAEQDFTGRLIVTEDAGPDDHSFCPSCDRELTAEEVVSQ